MKPDGKIQGVDVWVRQVVDCPRLWIVTNHWSVSGTTRWLQKDGALMELRDVRRDDINFPSREAALAHLRTLEAKEKPVIDLSTAKFGDRFVMNSGTVSPPYACKRLGFDGQHIMQDGSIYYSNGKLCKNEISSFDLVAPYVAPRTVERWVVAWADGQHSCTYQDEHIAKLRGRQADRPFAIRKITLTEGEGLN